MRGAFSDLGVTGERNVGKTVATRTVMRIESADHYVFELYFKPPGGTEMLAN